MKRKTVYWPLAMALCLVLTGCSLGFKTSVARVTAIVELQGPEYAYPLMDATVTAGDARGTTGISGRALLAGIEQDRMHEFVVTTDFGTFPSRLYLDGNAAVELAVPLPGEINHDEFANVVFWFRSVNWRWRRGDVLWAYFDFSRSGLSTYDREAAVGQAEREFRSWLEGPGTSLRWGGIALAANEANVVVRMVNDDAYFNRFPEDRGQNVAARGGPMAQDEEGYTIRGEIWVRADCCRFQDGLYAHELGHVLGMGHPADLFSARTVMGYSHQVAEAGTVDRLMLQVKMHLPPGIPYNPQMAALRSAGLPEPLPTPVR
ncbi:MAG: hypothetical protein H0Z37_08560 [Firmicutes bacterium]|nr:hypothetical protein [Bacillota bacterium]